MRVTVSNHIIPHHVKVFASELDCECQAEVFKIHLHWWIVEFLIHGALRYQQFSTFEYKALNILSLQCHPIIDAYFFLVRLKTNFGDIPPLEVGILDNDAQWSDPGDLLTVCIGNKASIHLQVLIADEVEGKLMFTLNSVAE